MFFLEAVAMKHNGYGFRSWMLTDASMIWDHHPAEQVQISWGRVTKSLEAQGSRKAELEDEDGEVRLVSFFF